LVRNVQDPAASVTGPMQPTCRRQSSFACDVRGRLEPIWVQPLDFCRRAAPIASMESPRVIPNSYGAGSSIRSGGVTELILVQRVLLFNGAQRPRLRPAASYIGACRASCERRYLTDFRLPKVDSGHHVITAWWLACSATAQRGQNGVWSPAFRRGRALTRAGSRNGLAEVNRDVGSAAKASRRGLPAPTSCQLPDRGRRRRRRRRHRPGAASTASSMSIAAAISPPR